MEATRKRYSRDVIQETFRKMLADKKSIHKYVKKYGTLSGFPDATVRFAKPL